jgi:hypothetical protein
MEWQTLVIEAAAPARRGLVLLGLVLTLSSCAPAPRPNQLVQFPDAAVLFTTPAQVNVLCHALAVNAKATDHIFGCYFPSERLAIVPHDDPAVLAHELRHAREGAFHK